MLLKANTSMQPMKSEIWCCLPFPFNWTVMKTTYFPAFSLDINNRGFTRVK